MMLANYLAGCFLVALLWDIIPSQHLMIWLAIVFIFSTLTLILYLYLRPAYKNLETVPGQPIYFLLPLLFGTIWGSAGFFFFTPESVTHTSYLIIFLYGMASGGVHVLSPIWSSFLALVIPLLMPFIGRLVYQGYTHYLLIAATLFTFMIIMIAISKMTEMSTTKSLKIRYENTNLLKTLKEQSAKAEKANKEKSRFLAAASHDLRQPVHSLTLLTNAIDSEVKTERGKKILDQINNANETMLNLLHSLLDISKLDAGIIKPDFRTINLQDTVGALMQEFQATAKENRLTLKAQCDKPFFTNSDPVLLETIIRNLLQNAIRYTKTGKVLISCRKKGKHILLQVWDTGRGISEHDQEIIFAEYQQLNNPERDQNKGLGLGLSICRRLSKLLDIELTLKSQLEKGSVFTLELPYLKSDPTFTSTEEHIDATAPQAYQPLKGAVILVIDDNESVLNAMSSLLSSWECIAITARSIEEAVKVAKTSNEKINAIVADYRLRNNTTGIEAIEAFSNAVDYDTPSIIITGDTAPDRLHKAASHGLPVLHKPIKEPHLKAVISRLLRNL